MLTSLDFQVMAELAPIPLERNDDGTFPYPSMRCGIIPYFYQNNQILWGGVRSDRIGPTTIAFPAGTQDILIIKDDLVLSLETGKPLPDLTYLGYTFIQDFVGKSFRDQTYQNVIHTFYENGFTVYIENPLATALHESAEEHGIDLRASTGRDFHLLESIRRLPIQKFSARQDVCLWIASLKNIEGIVLKETDKVEKKIRRNYGRKFREQGCWADLNEFKAYYLEAKDGVDSGEYTHKCVELLESEIDNSKETIELLDSLEWLIKAEFKLSQFPRGISPVLSSPPLRNENSITDIVTVKTALESISYDTWLILDLDNTVMKSVLELASDHWFDNLLVHATQRMPDHPKKAQELSLLIYGAVQAHVRAHVRAQPVEHMIVKIIRALQDVGIPVIALTARQSLIKHSTVRQLNAIGIDFSRNSIVNICDLAYYKGIIFCDAKDKGTVWQAFIEKSSRRPRHIVMLDDKLEHLKCMSETTQRLRMNFTGLRYGLFDQKVNSFDMEKANQQLAFLKKYLPNPVQQAIDQLQLIPVDFEATIIPQKSLYGFFSDTISNHFYESESCSPSLN